MHRECERSKVQLKTASELGNHKNGLQSKQTKNDGPKIYPAIHVFCQNVMLKSHMERR